MREQLIKSDTLSCYSVPSEVCIDAHFYSPNTLGGMAYFKNEEIKGQRRSQAVCPRSHSQYVAELRFGPRYGWLEIPAQIFSYSIPGSAQ